MPVLGSVLLTACLAQSVVVVGETPIPPPSEIPTVAVVVMDDAGEPIVGALADTEYGQEVTDGSGVFRVRWDGEPTSASVQAQGFFPGAVEVGSFQDEPVELALRPVVLRGAVVDSQGFGLPIASVSLGDVNVMTDDQGGFEISRASPGTITVERPGWVATEFAWDGEILVHEIELEPYLIRALHIGHTVYVDDEQWSELLSIAEDTVVNALVIDVKDESGRVLYDTEVSLAREVGAVDVLFDIDRVVTQMDVRGLYKIARLVTFQDPIAARAIVEMAVFDAATGTSFRKRNQYFLDPTDQQAREYALRLAEEVCAAGFDEIQFDYVRFPDGYPDTAVFYI